MDDEEFLKDKRRALRESVEFFSQRKKSERERWVCREFVKNLGIVFDETEISSPKDDPPDVTFRTARFEIKELLDPGRLRDAEYKAAYKRALEISDPQDLLQTFTPQDITPLQVCDRILGKLKNLAAHYPPPVRLSLDLLFYVNLQDHCLQAGPMPNPQVFASFGWRSISALVDHGALVCFADRSAPSILSSAIGTVNSPRRMG